MAKEKNIKRINRKYLVAYMFANLVLFSIFSTMLTIEISINNLGNILFTPKSILIILLFLLSIVFEGIISSEIKAVLIFWKVNNPLPGSYAFSKIAKHDSRIDVELLKTHFPDGFPSKPDEQNKAWYKLYRKHSSKNIVFEAHRAFLLTRDLAALAIILLPITVAGHIIFTTPMNYFYFHGTTLLLGLLITIVSSRNYGNRFVANVLAEETNSD